MKTQVIKRSIKLSGGHKTSFSMEEPFFQLLIEEAQRQKKTLGQLVAGVDDERNGAGHGNLSSCLRLFALRSVTQQSHPHIWSDAPAQIGGGAQ